MSIIDEAKLNQLYRRETIGFQIPSQNSDKQKPNYRSKTGGFLSFKLSGN